MQRPPEKGGGAAVLTHSAGKAVLSVQRIGTHCPQIQLPRNQSIRSHQLNKVTSV